MTGHSLAARPVRSTDFPTLRPLDFRALQVICVGHDLDGCHWEFRDGYMASLARRFPHQAERYNNFVPGDHWNFFEDLNQSVEEFIEHYTWAMGEGLLANPEHTVHGSVEATRNLTERLAAVGRRVEHNIVTDRSVGEPFAGAHQTAAWAAAVQFPFSTIRIDHDKASVDNHVFVDDRYENYIDLRMKGVRAYLLTRPWNAAFDTPVEHRVKDVAEYCDRIFAAATVTGEMP